MYLHNNSGEDKTYSGREILDGEFSYIQPVHRSKLAQDEQLISDINDSLIAVSRDGVVDMGNIANMISVLTDIKPRFSLAVDLSDIDQTISGTDWHTVAAERIIWDLGENYDLVNNDIVVYRDGIYNFDVQLRFKSLINVGTIELALFKRVEGADDDYWFTLDKKTTTGLGEAHLNGNTQFDFYEGERYCLKVQFSGILLSGKINGADDYTAWGCSLSELL